MACFQRCATRSASILACVWVLAVPISAATIEDAHRQLVGGEYERAMESARALIEADSDDAGAYLILGAAEALAGELDRAAKHLQVAERIDPNVPDLYYHLGYVSAARARQKSDRGNQDKARRFYEEAAEHFSRQLDRSPEHLGALEGQARALRWSADTDVAIAAHERWIAASPEDSVGYVALIHVYLLNGRPVEAAAVVERMPSTDPEALVHATYTAGRWLYGVQESDLASGMFSRLGMMGVEPWRIHGLTALEGLDNEDRYQASRAFLRFLRADPPAAERTGLFRTYRTLQAVAPFTEWPDNEPGPDGLTPPRIVSRTHRKGAQLQGGSIIVVVVIGVDGRIIDETYSILSTDRNDAFLRKAAVDAIGRWRFEPARYSGEPIEYPVPLVFGQGRVRNLGWGGPEWSLSIDENPFLGTGVPPLSSTR